MFDLQLGPDDTAHAYPEFQHVGVTPKTQAEVHHVGDQAAQDPPGLGLRVAHVMDVARCQNKCQPFCPNIFYDPEHSRHAERTRSSSSAICSHRSHLFKQLRAQIFRSSQWYNLCFSVPPQSLDSLLFTPPYLHMASCVMASMSRTVYLFVCPIAVALPPCESSDRFEPHTSLHLISLFFHLSNSALRTRTVQSRSRQ